MSGQNQEQAPRVSVISRIQIPTVQAQIGPGIVLLYTPTNILQLHFWLHQEFKESQSL